MSGSEVYSSPNLRACTYAQNAANRALNREAGYRGVHLDQRGRYRVTIGVGGKNKHLGFYGNPTDGARAFDAEAKKLRGEFAVLNFPEDC